MLSRSDDPSWTVGIGIARCQRRRSNRHTVSPKHINHLLAVRRTSGGGADYFCSFSEIRWSHDRWRYNGELIDILVTEIIEAVHAPRRIHRACPGPPSPSES